MKKEKVYIINFNIILSCLLLFMILNLNTINLITWAFIISFIFCIYFLMKHVIFLSASFFFLIFYLMLFYLQPILSPLLDISLTNNIHTFRLFSILVIMGIHLFMIGNSFVSPKRVCFVKQSINQASIDRAIKILFFILILSMALSFIDAGTLNLLSLSRMELKNSGSLLRFLATMGFYTTSLMFFLVFYSMKNRKLLNIIMWFFLFIIIEVVIFLLFRTRSLMVVHMCSVLVGLYYNNYFLSKTKKIKFSTKFFTSISAIIILISAITFRFLRGYLQPTSNVYDFQLDLAQFIKISLENGDLGYGTTLIQLLNSVPYYHDYLYGQSYYRLGFTFIPRFVWKDKPENTQQIVADWLMPGVEGQTIPPGINGDLYINFGVLGILFMILFGLFIGLLDKNMTMKHFLIWASSATWIFHLVRGGFTNPVIIFLCIYLIVSLLDKYIFKKEKAHSYNIKKYQFGD